MTIIAHPTITRDAIAMASLQRRFGLFAIHSSKHTRLIQRKKTPRPVTNLPDQPSGDDFGPWGGDAA